MIYGTEIPQDDTARAGLLDRMTLPWTTSLGASAENAFVHNPLTSLWDAGKLFLAEHPAARTTIANVGLGEAGQPLIDPNAPDTDPVDEFQDPKDLNEKYGQSLGLTFDQPTRAGAVAIMVRRKQEEIDRNAYLNRQPGGFMFGAANFATQLAVSATDPLNIASAFIPVVGEARAAMWAERYGRTAARFMTGAVEGAVGAAAVEPINYGAAKYLGDDYDMGDSLMNVAVGGVLGGGLHVGFGAISDRLNRAAPETREAALRGAVANMAEGRDVQVDHILSSDPIMRPGGVEAADILDAADRIDRTNQRVDAAQQRLAAIESQRQNLESLGSEAANLDTLSKGASPELISRGLDDVTGQRLRDIADELGLPAAPAARRDWLQRQHDMIMESIAPDLELARGRVAAEAKAVSDMRDRAQAEFDAQRATLADHHAELTAALKAAAKAEHRYQALADRAVAERDIPAPHPDAAAPSLMRASDPGADAAQARQMAASAQADSAGAAAASLDRARTASLEYGRDREASSAASSPETSAAADQAVRAARGDDLDTELTEALAAVDAFEKQGALTPEEAEAARAGRDDIQKANRDGEAARAAARCLLLHP